MGFSRGRVEAFPCTFTGNRALISRPEGTMSNSRRVVHGVIAVLACLGLSGLPAPAEAQRSDRAAISGVVTDNQGAAVPGASVTIRNEATGVEVVLTTNEAGAYSRPRLAPGVFLPSGA